MIDRRTYLAGQALAGLWAADQEDKVGVMDSIDICVLAADNIIAELQRTCPEHLYNNIHCTGWALPTLHCSRCDKTLVVPK